jgi:hypothetical protein
VTQGTFAIGSIKSSPMGFFSGVSITTIRAALFAISNFTPLGTKSGSIEKKEARKIYVPGVWKIDHSMKCYLTLAVEASSVVDDMLGLWVDM